MKVFIEEQSFKKWWLLIIILISFVGVLFPFLFMKEESLEIESETFLGITITFITMFLTFGFIYSIKLNTKINEQGIFYRYFPIHFSKKFIPWNEIDSCAIRKYNSFSEYGGYGYRIRLFGKNKGKALNTGGNIGIQLELKNGKKLLIGTHKQQEVETVLRTYKMKLDEK